ncbi:MAG TPA: hypothetical protein VF940_27885 [Streptosporangiaceae bacterium]
MSVAPLDFRTAKGQFFSLEPLKTDRDGWITAIAVTIEGIVGCEYSRRRWDRAQYRLLASVQDLQSGLPVVWIASPRDQDIQHVNIFHPRAVCPFVGTMLPDICWGMTASAWRSVMPGERTLANLLEASRQVLSNANLNSRAR